MAEKGESNELDSLNTSHAGASSNGEYVAFRGRKISKKKLIIAAVVVLFIILLIIIIVLGALLGKERARHEEGKVDVGGKGGKGETPTTSVLPTTPGGEPYWNVRLPKDVTPEHYDITVRIDLDKKRYDGKVAIFVNVTSPTTYLLVHTNMINITESSVQKIRSDENLAVAEKFWFEKNQYYVMIMRDPVEPGGYILKMSYEGFLANEVVGLYLDSYTRPDGKKSTIASTVFEPTDARRAFPCFDEPAMKATFNVTVAHDPKLFSVSNMPRYSSKNIEGYQYDYFQKSVKMSTYLVAFTVGDFDSVAMTTNTSIKMTYYSPVGTKDQLNYAKITGNKLLTFYQDYFNVSYPLPKADMIVIPSFPSAMEHWGLMSYSPNNLLYKTGKSSESDKQQIESVIAHELSHQWFGNLVTMEWWSDLWLNEGFASAMSKIGMRNLHNGEWKTFDQFVIGAMESAFKLDGLASSHPVMVKVTHPYQIMAIFDSISYNKGASIILMLRNFLGEETFRRGLTRYLRKHAFANAETKGLWIALAEQSAAEGKVIDVKSIMDTWTLQMNYPVITIKKPTSGNVAEVVQERFLYNENTKDSSKYTSPFGYKWLVPFTFCKASSPCNTAKPGDNVLWLNKTNGQITWDGTGWIKGNVHHKGFYRVNYDKATWSELAKQLANNFQVFAPSDRAGLITDAFNLARANLTSYTNALELTGYLARETEYVPWKAAVQMFAEIADILPRASVSYKLIQKYLTNNAKLIYLDLGFKDSGKHIEKLFRSMVLNIFCKAGEQKCLNTTADYFRKWMADPEKNVVPADFRSLVYFTGIAQGGEKEWDFMFEQMKKSKVEADISSMLFGLSGSQDPSIISRYLDYSLDTSKISSSYTGAVINHVANNNPIGRQAAWNFFEYNWNIFKKRFGSGAGFFTLRNIIKGITQGFASNYELNQVKRFITKAGDLGVLSRSANQAVESVKSNIHWRQSYEHVIEKWLKSKI